MNWYPVYLWLFASFIGSMLVGPLVYWMISKKVSPLKAVKTGTYLAGALLLPGVVGAAVIFLSFFGLAWKHILLILLLGLVLQYLLAPRLVLRGVRARDPDPGESWLLSELEDLKRRINYRKRVELKIADISIPNAFAVSNFFRRVIVVHKGLLDLLDRNEIRAVLAHELGHIANRDSAYGIATSFIPYAVFVTGAAMMACGAAVLGSRSAEFRNPGGEFTRSFMEGMAAGAQSYGASAGFAVFLMMFIGAILAAFAGPGVIGVLSFSRMREHLADIFSARATGSDDVIKALRKIEEFAGAAYGVSTDRVPNLRNIFYIVPMLYSELFGFAGYMKWSKPGFTHPPLEAREFVVGSFFRRRM